MPPPNYSPSSGSKTSLGGSSNRERGIQRNQTQRVSKKSKSVSVDHRTTRNAQTHFVNTPTPDLKSPMHNTLTGRILTGAAKALDSITDASRKNRDFFDRNYDRIRANKSNIGLPDKATFDALPLSEKQALYTKTRLDIMQNRQNPLGEPLEIGGGGGGNNNTIVSGVVTNNGVVGPIIGSNAVKTPEQIKKEEEKKNRETGIIAAKRRGRSDTILTGSTGLMDEDDLIRKRTLLG